MEKSIFPEKLINYMDIARGVGEVALQTVRRMFERHHETSLHRPDHYELVLNQPKPNVYVYSCDGGDLPSQLQIDFETQPLGDCPDIKGRDLPPYDSEGRYL